MNRIIIFCIALFCCVFVSVRAQSSSGGNIPAQSSITLVLLNNQKDMALVLFDRTIGKAITDAKVKVDNKRIKYDSKTQSYYE